MTQGIVGVHMEIRFTSFNGAKFFHRHRGAGHE